MNNGRDFFDRKYQAELHLEAEWMRRTAGQKVRSVSSLLRSVRAHPESLLEIGCGTGAVIGECQRRGLAQRFIAVDYSNTALEYLRANSSGITVLQADITSSDFRFETPVDAAVCSHVIEHLEEPGVFLDALHQRIDFAHVIFEVPLEDLPGHRFRHRGADRLQNPSGHVQFFTAASFEALLQRHGFRILGRRRYVPILERETIRFQADRHGLSRTARWLKTLTHHTLPTLSAPLWSRLYYAHYAVVCSKA